MNWFKRQLYRLCPTCRPNHSLTVRFAFPVVFSALAILGAQAIVSQNETYVSVEADRTALRAGDPFSFNVYVVADVPVNAVDLAVIFPVDKVSVTGIDPGESVITLWTTDPYVEDNTVYLTGGTFRRGFTGKHLIATINAIAVANGVADIAVSNSLLLAGDGTGGEVDIAETGNELEKIFIASQDGTQIPEGYATAVSGTVDVIITTDVDGDGNVDLQDVSRFMAAWFNQQKIYDFNGDGRMSFTDFGIILSDSFFK